MSDCCAAANRPTRMDRLRGTLAWLLPSALLLAVPKCPACLAAHVMLWTGLGLSLSTAAYLRWAMLGLGVAGLLVLIWKRVDRRTILGFLTKGSSRWHIRS